MQKKHQKIWSIQKKAVLLHAFSLKNVKKQTSGCKLTKCLQTEKRSMTRSVIQA